MGFIQTFCFCCNVRTGSVVCALYSLITSVVYMSLVFIRYTDTDATEVHNGVMYSTLAVFGLEAVISIGLLVAVHTDRRILYVPYITETIICIIHGIVCNVWVMKIHLQDDRDIGSVELAILTYHIVNTIISIYCVLCVSSQLHDLINGKGTKDYYSRMNERQRRVMEFILSMQMLQEFDNPADIPFPPPALEGIDNAVFQHHTGAPLPPPLPTASASALDRPGSPAPPPPYSSLDRPPEYSTLPRVVMAAPSSAVSSQGEGNSASHPSVQGTRRQRGTGVAQDILQRQSNSSNNTGNNSRSSYRYSPRNEECPAYSAPSLGSSWNTHASSSSTSGANRDVITSDGAQNSRSQGNASASHDVSRRISDDCDGYSDISSVSCPRRTNVHRV